MTAPSRPADRHSRSPAARAQADDRRSAYPGLRPPTAGPSGSRSVASEHGGPTLVAALLASLEVVADWLGPHPRPSRHVIVPEFRRHHVSECFYMLADTGLHPRIVRLTAHPAPVDGVIVDQSPAAGSRGPAQQRRDAQGLASSRGVGGAGSRAGPLGNVARRQLPPEGGRSARPRPGRVTPSRGASTTSAATGSRNGPRGGSRAGRPHSPLPRPSMRGLPSSAPPARGATSWRRPRGARRGAVGRRARAPPTRPRARAWSTGRRRGRTRRSPSNRPVATAVGATTSAMLHAPAPSSARRFHRSARTAEGRSTDARTLRADRGVPDPVVPTDSCPRASHHPREPTDRRLLPGSRP